MNIQEVDTIYKLYHCPKQFLTFCEKIKIKYLLDKISVNHLVRIIIFYAHDNKLLKSTYISTDHNLRHLIGSYYKIHYQDLTVIAYNILTNNK